MIKRIFLALFIFLAINSFAQKSDINVIHTQKIVGRNLSNNKIVKADEYYFPKAIRNTYVDTSSNLLTVQLCKYGKSSGLLKNKGKLLVYNLSDGKIKWAKKVFYHTSKLQQHSNNIIHTIDHTSTCLNSKDGTKKWEVENNISYIDSECKVAIGYKYKAIIGYPNIIQGINLENGKVLWERKIKKEYGWNDILVMNDSVRMIVAAGLHTVNMNTGKGWDYKAMTGEENCKLEDKLPNGVTGVAEYSGVFTDPNTVKDVISNILMDDNHIYIASREKISRIDKISGKVIWSTPLQEDFTSKSSIFIQGDNVIMVNYGYAYYKNSRKDYGIPTIAAYNKKTGIQKYFSIVNFKEHPILDYKIKGDKLILMFADKFAEYSLATGKKLYEKEVDTIDEGNMMKFAGNHIYTEKEEKIYKSLPALNNSKNYAFTDKNLILVLDSEFNILNRINYSELSACYLMAGKLKFISQGNKTIVINKEGKKVAELYLTSKAFIIGKKIYDIQNQSFLVVDLSSIAI